MSGTFKNYIKSLWKPFKSKDPKPPKNSGQTDDRRRQR